MSLLLAASFLLCAASPECVVSTLDAQEQIGTISELTSDRLVLETSDGSVEVPIADLAQVRVGKNESSTPADATGSLQVEFVDGSVFLVESVTADGEITTCRLDADSPITVPMKVLRSIRFASGADARETDDEQWQEILAKAGASDLLVIRRSEALDYVAGALHDITDEACRFELAGEVMPVPRERVFGIIFHKGTLDVAEPLCEYKLPDGSRWSIQSIESSTNNKFTATTAANVTVDLPWLDGAILDFAGERIVALCDITPERWTWTPRIPLAGLVAGTDENPALHFLGPSPEGTTAAIRLGEQTFDTAIAMRAKTEAVYRTAGEYERIRATAGMDEHASGSSHAVLVIQGDNRVLLEQAFTPDQAPVEIDLDITNVQRLTIRVEFGEGMGLLGDWIYLCNARLMK